MDIQHEKAFKEYEWGIYLRLHFLLFYAPLTNFSCTLPICPEVIVVKLENAMDIIIWMWEHVCFQGKDVTAMAIDDES